MKKFLSLLLALSMILSLAACGGGNDPAGNGGGNNQGGDQQGEQNPGDDDAGGSNAGGSTSHANRIIYGSTTGLSGDIGLDAYWTNNADDAKLRSLINDYSTVAVDQGGAYVQNNTVCESIESTLNEDGTKTFTVKIKDGLTFNNGEPITIEDFVVENLIFYSPAAIEAQVGVVTGTVVGDEAYATGEVNYISGLRILDDHTLSVTIEADKVPSYFEMGYASFRPVYLPMYTSADLTVKDDGNGVYLDGGELKAEEIDATRRMYDSPVGAGPYILKSLDESTSEAVLEINPYYAGNFEGQKPSIQQIVMIKTTTSTEFDALRSGAVDLLSQLSDGSEITTAMDMVEQGGFEAHQFERSGYGKIQFQCDFGPTQFEAVRHAVAYLLDREEFANTFCKGWGAVVHGPYGMSSWMFKDSEEYFASALDTYSYNPAKAVEILEADGWTLNADGTEYSGSGTRYKKVTAEEAGTYELNVTLDDGTILMPLHIMWCSTEDNPVSELLSVMLSNGTQVAEAGMVIQQTTMTFDELLLYMYRDGTQGDRYGVPTYGMYNLASNFPANYSYAYSYTTDPRLWAAGRNNNFIYDEELDRLTMDSTYGVESGDDETYLDYWQQIMVRWNKLLPDIPLYSNIYVTITPDWLKGYEESSLWNFENAILYCTIENAE